MLAAFPEIAGQLQFFDPNVRRRNCFLKKDERVSSRHRKPFLRQGLDGDLHAPTLSKRTFPEPIVP